VHAPQTPGRPDDRRARFDEVRGEMDRVLSLLLPGERLPYDLSGFVPRTRAAVAAYAEAYAAGVSGPVRRTLFESFWMHGIDIGDAHVLRTLVSDELRSGSSPSEPVRTWGIPVDVTGGPISTVAWRRVERWASDWRDTGQVVPVVMEPGRPPIIGVEAVEWLGTAIAARGLDPDPDPDSWNRSLDDPLDYREQPSLGWVAANGGAWLHRTQRLAASELRHR
jgi:hypothetical protein